MHSYLSVVWIIHENSKLILIYNFCALFFSTQAKKFVESVPAVIKADIGKDEAEKIKEQVEKAGGSVEIEWINGTGWMNRL